MQLLRGGTVVPATPENIANIGGTERARQNSGIVELPGRVKFILPNAQAIYLHDTPAKTLFDKARRDYSHGCVRLSDPLALARFVLRDQPAWTADRIAAAMGADTPTNVTLSHPIRCSSSMAPPLRGEMGRYSSMATSTVTTAP